jgi:predicted nicotinamide N-methyase
MPDPLRALKTSLRERLAALRGVGEDELPPSLLEISVRRVGIAYYVCPADWEQLRHEEGGAGRPVPYWARPWPSGVGLAGHLHDHPPRPNTTVLELGCGLALPSVIAAQHGAKVLATDGATDAVVFAAHTLALNEVEGDVAHVDWSTHGDALVERGPFDLVLAADVLYTRANVEAAAALFPRLVRGGGTLLIADPNRAGARHFLERFEHESQLGEDVSLHTLRFDGPAAGHTQLRRGPSAY